MFGRNGTIKSEIKSTQDRNEANFEKKRKKQNKKMMMIENDTIFFFEELNDD